MTKGLVTALLLSASIATMTTTALAQTAAPAGAAAGTAPVAEEPVQEIVVTAQKRVERLQDVPLSITVASQAQLERQQVNTVADLTRLAPSLEVAQAPGQNVGGGGQIRGIGTQSFQAGAVGSVGVVVDQVSQGNANISDLFDVARVEVLKGPQGTLFGLTTSAGVINVTTNAPDPQAFSARVRSELSNAGTAGSKFGQQLVQGVVNVPLAENAALRVSGNVNLRQGPQRNALDDTLDKHHTYGGRARLLWQPSDRVTINLIGDYTHVDEEADFFIITRASSPLTQGLLAACGITASTGSNRYCANIGYPQAYRTYGGSGQMDYDAGPFVITSVTSYRGSDVKAATGSIFRLDGNPLQIVNTAGPTRNHLFTQELRVASPAKSRLEYTVGSFFSHSRAVVDPVTQNVTLSPAPGVVIPLVTNISGRNTTTDESLAVFGQATYHLTDRLSLIGGGRFTSEKLALDQYFAGLGGLRYHQALSTENVSWKGGARYEFSRDFNVYGFASRGYKGGQVSIPSSPTSAPTIVKPEIPLDYEIGTKGSLFDRRLNFDISAFYIKLKDFQGQDCTQGPPPTNTLVCVVTNVSRITSKGIEASLFGQPLPGLTLNGGLLYDEVHYPSGYLDSTGASLAGRQVAFAPKWKATFSGEYAHAITDRAEAFLAGDVVYKSKLRLNTFLTDDVSFHAHATVGGRLGVRAADGRWTISAFARNLFDVHEPATIYTGFPNGGDLGSILTPQAFRQVGLSLDARF